MPAAVGSCSITELGQNIQLFLIHALMHYVRSRHYLRVSQSTFKRYHCKILKVIVIDGRGSLDLDKGYFAL